MVADLEHVDEMDASDFHDEKLNAKEVILHKLVKIIFPIADGTVKTYWSIDYRRNQSPIF